MKARFFTPEDFDDFVKGNYPLGMKTMDAIAYFANEKFQKFVDASPKAYGNSTQFDIVSSPTSSDTHSAVIMFIEEIVKEPCKHEPKFHTLMGKKVLEFANPPECRICGTKLVLHWEAVEK